LAMIDKYNELLRAFAAQVGIDPDVFVETQEIVIEGFAIGLDFEGADDFGDVVYFCTLGAPAPARKAEIYKTVLEANCLWVGTAGATIGLQQETGRLLIAGRIDLQGLDALGFGHLLDAFVDTAAFWKKHIAGEAQ
jgi:hypothetical protein